MSTYSFWTKVRPGELPPQGYAVLVTLSSYEMAVGYHIPQGWRQQNGEPFLHNVTHWAKLPTLPELPQSVEDLVQRAPTEEELRAGKAIKGSRYSNPSEARMLVDDLLAELAADVEWPNAVLRRSLEVIKTEIVKLEPQ